MTQPVPDRDVRATPGGRAFSLRWRLLVATACALVPALLLAGWLLGALFREHVMRQFSAGLVAQLDALTARLDVDAQGQPVLDARDLVDPRWGRPYSGLYWQLDRAGRAPAAPGRQAVLRSRSLWDASLEPPPDQPGDGEVHVHEISGPDGAPLLLVERTVRLASREADAWRLMVAADRHATELAAAEFRRVLGLSLAGLFGLLVLAALAQIEVGLAPMRRLRAALADLRASRSTRLEGRFPAEVQPLVDDFNTVVLRQAQSLERARTQAGNLAHALKTPLAVMAQAASAQPADAAQAHTALAALVSEQVAQARRQVDWHLARARAAAAHATPGMRTPVAPVAAQLMRVMARIHAGRGLQLHTPVLPEPCVFAGESQDLQEMLGNLLDNACRWAHTQVRIGASLTQAATGPALRLWVEDDGPGIASEAQARALTRGQRLDESQPGSGLGLAIVAELAGLYGGALSLEQAQPTGLRAVLDLPAVAT